ncbi:MAG: hypothetical protein HC778_06930, partial [Chamaesiphon sp. CSU_1_12]|nr:hypothetical protein [Chamaesiphon sp. CSU_1_12]
FENLALYPATVPTYIREIQQRLILAPLVNAVGSDRVAEFANIYLGLAEKVFKLERSKSDVIQSISFSSIIQSSYNFI